jgi:hypothetical protein
MAVLERVYPYKELLLLDPVQHKLVATALQDYQNATDAEMSPYTFKATRLSPGGDASSFVRASALSSIPIICTCLIDVDLAECKWHLLKCGSNLCEHVLLKLWTLPEADARISYCTRIHACGSFWYCR